MSLSLMIIPTAFVVWAFQRWVQSQPKFELPVWRSFTALVAFCLAAASVVLWVFFVSWALIRGGFPFYDPVVLRMYRLGMLLGLAGFIVSLPGKGKLRWSACGVAAFMTVLWAAASTAE